MLLTSEIRLQRLAIAAQFMHQQADDAILEALPIALTTPNTVVVTASMGSSVVDIQTSIAEGSTVGGAFCLFLVPPGQRMNNVTTTTCYEHVETVPVRPMMIQVQFTINT